MIYVKDKKFQFLIDCVSTGLKCVIVLFVHFNAPLFCTFKINDLNSARSNDVIMLKDATCY